jgi:hypothetical protein
LVDRIRGNKPTANSDGTRKVHSFVIPHFPDTDFISPKDLQSRSAYDNFDAVAQLDKVRMDKISRMRMKHDWTLNKARAQALLLGTAYAPNGTITQNWNTEFGVTRTDVDFALGTPTTNIQAKCELIIQGTHDGMGGNGTFNDIVVFCDTLFFNRLISHAKVEAIWVHQQTILQGQDPIRSRLSTGGTVMQNGRQITIGALTFREVRDSYNGVGIMTASEGVSVPIGSNFFRTYFAPAEKFGLVNTLGEKMYAFEKQVDDEKITIDTESNHISALLRPQAVLRAYTSN